MIGTTWHPNMRHGWAKPHLSKCDDLWVAQYRLKAAVGTTPQDAFMELAYMTSEVDEDGFFIVDDPPALTPLQWMQMVFIILALLPLAIWWAS